MALTFGIAGQSLAQQMSTVGTDLTAVNVTLWGGATFDDPGTTGNGQISFGNQVAVSAGTNVQLINGGAGSTALTLAGDNGVNGYWLDATAGEPYQLFKDQVTASGATLDYIVWAQGQRDALSGAVSQSAYEAGLTTLFARFRTDFGANIPIIVIGMGSNTNGANDADWQGIRSAIKAVCDVTSNCILAANTMAIPLVDGIHPTAAGYTTQGTYAFLGYERLAGNLSSAQGPSVVSVENVSETQTRVAITHTNGTTFTPTTGITGFEVSGVGDFSDGLTMPYTHQQEIYDTNTAQPLMYLMPCLTAQQIHFH
jgi:hypothetical protein